MDVLKASASSHLDVIARHVKGPPPPKLHQVRRWTEATPPRLREAQVTWAASQRPEFSKKMDDILVAPDGPVGLPRVLSSIVVGYAVPSIDDLHDMGEQLLFDVNGRYSEMDWRTPLACEDLRDRIQAGGRASKTRIGEHKVQLKSIKDGVLRLEVANRAGPTFAQSMTRPLGVKRVHTPGVPGRPGRDPWLFDVYVHQLLRRPELMPDLATGLRISATSRWLAICAELVASTTSVLSR